ncbi:hypothetical protein P4O66_007049 [Electrophorus voltai]|uniref:Uncharacterized protein n=1 Tax=Electrophorus voltai TaxID=2609070 RepID=A0AAD9DYJ0_9TELE|nr:hypothetical protein P4O66_007049 [Electrophorus voltai]
MLLLLPGDQDEQEAMPRDFCGLIQSSDLPSGTNHSVFLGMKTSVPSSNGATGPASQIPGLSQSAETGPVERTSGRRVGIQATDSDYVKLAKQGGHKGLLSHDNTDDNPKSGSLYSPPNWFSAEDGQQSQSKGSSQRLLAPFGTDDGPSSDQESDASPGTTDKWFDTAVMSCSTPLTQKVLVGQAAQELQKLSLNPKDIEEANRYKRMSHEKKAAAPVSMTKLLSFGYVEEDKKSPDEDTSSKTAPPSRSGAVWRGAQRGCMAALRALLFFNNDQTRQCLLMKGLGRVQRHGVTDPGGPGAVVA